MSDMTAMNPMSTNVLWEGSSVDLSSVATGGRVSGGSYKVTDDAVRFASGVLSSREEVIPLWAVADVDITQSMGQKARGVADVRLKIDPAHVRRFGQFAVILKSIREPQRVRDLIAWQANQVRAYWAQRLHERTIEQRQAGATQISTAVAVPPPAPGAPAAERELPTELPTPSASDDLLSKLVKLGELHAAGVLTDDEFTAAKAKLLA